MRTVGVFAVMVLLLTACGAERARAIAPTNSPAVRTSTATAPANSRQVRCELREAHLETKFLPTADDIVAGPLLWPGLRTWATADPQSMGANDNYKLGAVVQAGSSVTVTVAPEARAYAGLAYGQQWSYTPAAAITFQACDKFDTAFVGGFHVVGQRCVPFDIREGDQPPTRVVVSFFTGKPCA
jgi:hypothetical protein